MSCQILRTPCVTLSQLESRLGQRARELSFFEKGSGCGEKNRYLTTTNPFERFNSFACDFRMGLYLTESFARWIERYEACVAK